MANMCMNYVTVRGSSDAIESLFNSERFDEVTYCSDVDKGMNDSKTAMNVAFGSSWTPPIELYDALVSEGFEVVGSYGEEGMGVAGYYANGVDEEAEYDAWHLDVEGTHWDADRLVEILETCSSDEWAEEEGDSTLVDLVFERVKSAGWMGSDWDMEELVSLLSLEDAETIRKYGDDYGV